MRRIVGVILAITPIVSLLTFAWLAQAVMLEAGISFLGLAIQPPNPSLGLMLQEALGYIRGDAWFGICPGVLLILIILALNAAADTLGQLANTRATTGGARSAL